MSSECLRIAGRHCGGDRLLSPRWVGQRGERWSPGWRSATGRGVVRVCRGLVLPCRVSQRTVVGTFADVNPVVIGPATEDDLPGIVEILNYTVANSIASFATWPTCVAERRDWFGQFSSIEPYRLLVNRRGDPGPGLRLLSALSRPQSLPGDGRGKHRAGCRLPRPGRG
jgi:hypothetical protein